MKQYEPLLYQWVINENRGFTIEKYLVNLGAQKILIYGAGVIGELLFQVLRKGEIQVLGFVDQNKGLLLEELHGVPITTLDQVENIWNCDIIVVTLGHMYYEIKDRIKGYNKELQTISIEDIVYGMMRGDE